MLRPLQRSTPSFETASVKAVRSAGSDGKRFSLQLLLALQKLLTMPIGRIGNYAGKGADYSSGSQNIEHTKKSKSLPLPAVL